MLSLLLSEDQPRSRTLAVIMVLILLGLLLTPFLIPGARSFNVAARICIFIILACSYDILLGYTGIVSFAHLMFFGFGSYGVAIAMSQLGASWFSFAIGSSAALALAVAFSVLVGLLSLRLQAIFFSMITLALGSLALILATDLRSLTGGEDGLTYSIPAILTASYRFYDERVLGIPLDGRLLLYYVIAATSLLCFLVMLRIVNSPFGQVLVAIRENDVRAEALGYRVVVYRTLANVISAVFATLAGILLGLLLRYTGPDSALSFSLMVDVLLMVVIGGMGTLYGAVIGATLITIAHYYLQVIASTIAPPIANISVLAIALHPDRWPLWLGLSFVTMLYLCPNGVVGQLRGQARRGSAEAADSLSSHGSPCLAVELAPGGSNRDRGTS